MSAFIRMFENDDPESLLCNENLFKQFEYSIMNNGVHGNVHIIEVAPMLLTGYHDKK